MRLSRSLAEAEAEVAVGLSALSAIWERVLSWPHAAMISLPPVCEERQRQTERDDREKDLFVSKEDRWQEKGKDDLSEMGGGGCPFMAAKKKKKNALLCVCCCFCCVHEIFGKSKETKQQQQGLKKLQRRRRRK